MVIVNHIVLKWRWSSFLYSRRHIKLTTKDYRLPHDIEGMLWLLSGSYHSPSQSDEYFLHQAKKGLDVYSKFYERHILIGDFDLEESEPYLSRFLFEINAKKIVMEPICYKSLSNPSCIDLVITNSSSSS